jgi:hypothetical protein
MSNDDVKKLLKAISNQAGAEDLEEAIAQQDRINIRNLEALGIHSGPQHSVPFGVCQLSNEQEAETLCRELNGIAGIHAEQKQGRVIVTFKPTYSQSSEESADSVASANRVKISWMQTVPKK